MSCQSGIGGFSKVPDAFPDVLHTYFSICGLCLVRTRDFLPFTKQGGEPGFKKLDSRLGFIVQTPPL